MSQRVRFVSARHFREEAKRKGGMPEDLGVHVGMLTRVAKVQPTTKAEDDEARASRRMLFSISSEAIDRDTDTIAVDGWDLGNYRRNPVVLFGHNYSNNDAPVVGTSLSEFVENGFLRSLMEFPPQGMVPLADTLHGLYSLGFMRATSVGFIPKEFDFVEDDEKRPFGIDFKQQELLEYSLVSVPSNPEALQVARAKGVDTAPLHAYLAQVLDEWSLHRSKGLHLPKREVEEIARLADPKQPTTAPVSAPGVDGLKALLAKALKQTSEVQTVLFLRSAWTAEQAEAWLEEHGLKAAKLDETEEHLRYRQFDPEACEDGTFRTLTEDLPEGVELVVCDVADGDAARGAGGDDDDPPPAAPAEPVPVAAVALACPSCGVAVAVSASAAEQAIRCLCGVELRRTEGGDALEPSWLAAMRAAGVPAEQIEAARRATTRDPDADPPAAPDPPGEGEGDPEGGDLVSLSDDAEAALEALGIDLDAPGYGAGEGEGLTPEHGAGDDGGAPPGESAGAGDGVVVLREDGSEGSLGDVFRELLGEVIGEGVRAAVTEHTST